MKYVMNHLIWFVLLLLAQLLLIDNLHFLGVFIPVLYIYALLSLPSKLSSYVVVLISFANGMIVDVFSNTPGLNAAATTLAGGLRDPLRRLFILKEDMSSRTISVDWMGRTVFWQYAVILVLIHHSALFLLESFSFFNLWTLLLKIPVCSLLTLLFIMAMELINRDDHARKS